MSNKCPNCGRKLSPLYFKQNCPGCGVNLLYFDMAASLEKDRVQAQREISAVRRFLYGIKISAVGSVWGVFKIIGALLQIAVLFIPVYYMDSSAVQGRLSALSLIKAFFDLPAGMGAGEFAVQYILPNTGVLLAVAVCIFILLFSLACIVIQLFSYTKNAMLRNFVFSAAGTAVFLALSIAAAANGAVLAGGFYMETALLLVGFVLSAPLEKKLRVLMEKYDAEPQAEETAEEAETVQK